MNGEKIIADRGDAILLELWAQFPDGAWFSFNLGRLRPQLEKGEEHTEEEVARHLGVARGTVHQQLWRAYEKARKNACAIVSDARKCHPELCD